MELVIPVDASPKAGSVIEGCRVSFAIEEHTSMQSFFLTIDGWIEFTRHLYLGRRLLYWIVVHWFTVQGDADRCHRYVILLSFNNLAPDGEHVASVVSLSRNKIKEQ